MRSGGSSGSAEVVRLQVRHFDKLRVDKKNYLDGVVVWVQYTGVNVSLYEIYEIEFHRAQQCAQCDGDVDCPEQA